ncbi:MAG: substrate-binding domain-containing protein [Chthonomonadales bacterium]|nr:substrate-binding domain-containing protein [Chthonomonadales bacterium]
MRRTCPLRRPTARALAAALGCAELALVGCSAPKPSGAPGGPGEAASRFAIAGVGFQNDQFFKLTELGMKAAADKAGVDISLGNSAGSLDREISLVDTYIAQDKDALVIAPYNQKASLPALKRAHDSGMKVVTFDSFVDADFPVSTIRSDQVSLGATTGEEAARYIREGMGGKARVAVVTYLSLMPIAAGERNKGFEEAVRKLPGVRIVAKQDAWMAEKAVGVVEGILTAHPDVDLIWAANEGGTVGAVTAVKNAGLAGKVVVFGTDMSEQMAGFLLDPASILQAVTGQKPFEIGERALETAVKALKGEPVEKRIALPGLLFTRTRPEEVTKYRDYLRGIAR